MVERLFSAFVGGFLASLVLAFLLVGLSVADDYLFRKDKNTKRDGEDESEARENRNVNSDLPASIYYVDNTNDSVESQQEQHELVETTK